MSEGFRPIQLRVNYNTAKLIDTDGEPLLNSSLPVFRFGEEGVLEVTFVKDDLTAQPLNQDDTFEFYLDNDFVHILTTGKLTQAYSGTVTSISIDGLTTVPAMAGNLTLYNSSNQSESIHYSSYTVASDVYMFVVSGTLSYSYLENDSCYTFDPLMIYSANSQVDISGDWADIDRSQGKISIRYNAFSNVFDNKIGTSNTIKSYIQINRYVAGHARPSPVMQYNAFASNVVKIVEGDRYDNQPDTYLESEVDALIDGTEIEQTYRLENVDFRTVQQNLVDTVPVGKIFIPLMVSAITTAITYEGYSSSSTESVSTTSVSISTTSDTSLTTTTETTTSETSLTTTTETTETTTSFSTTTETTETSLTTTSESSLSTTSKTSETSLSSTSSVNSTTSETTETTLTTTSETSETSQSTVSESSSLTTTSVSTTSESSLSTTSISTETTTSETSESSQSTTTESTTSESSSSTQQTKTTTSETSETSLSTTSESSSSTQQTKTTTSETTESSLSTTTETSLTTTSESSLSSSSSSIVEDYLVEDDSVQVQDDGTDVVDGVP